jgi:hypothetical protein
MQEDRRQGRSEGDAYHYRVFERRAESCCKESSSEQEEQNVEIGRGTEPPIKAESACKRFQIRKE